MKPVFSVKMSCKGSGYSFTNYYMPWVKQWTGHNLEWIGWIHPGNGDTYYNQKFKGKATLTKYKFSSTAYLHHNSLTSEHPVVYKYARYSVATTF